MKPDRQAARLRRFRIRNNERKILINIFHTLHALEDDRLREGTLQFVVECFKSARDGGKRECFGCHKPWTFECSPVAVMVIEPLGRPGRKEIGMLAGLCLECADNEPRIYAACKRDFGSSPTPMPEAGNA